MTITDTNFEYGNTTTAMRLVGAVSIWTIVATVASFTNIFEMIPMYGFALVVVAATIVMSSLYFVLPSVRHLAERIGPYGLAAFHVWRIPAALTFLWYGYHGYLPEIFVNLAGWGDMLAGVLAAIVISIPRSLFRITAFHMIGFADFVVAVGTGLTLTLLAVPEMGTISTLPVALIPLVGVPISAATHIAAFHMLWKGKNV